MTKSSAHLRLLEILPMAFFAAASFRLSGTGIPCAIFSCRTCSTWASSHLLPATPGRCLAACSTPHCAVLLERGPAPSVVPQGQHWCGRVDGPPPPFAPQHGQWYEQDGAPPLPRGAKMSTGMNEALVAPALPSRPNTSPGMNETARPASLGAPR
eukprot:365391-Chlamydomonas_euryale.AAC.15